IRGGASINGYYYDTAALQAIAKLVENAQAYVDHARFQTDTQVLLKTVYTRAGEELTDPQDGCKLRDIKIRSSGEQPCLGVRQC
ncbi:MAG: hypothetical protein M3Z24_13765, partial [Chloroflexota bacterium]|nr:hypothetical protein [Chloroflexota bacterium]